jgi:hypothetical protein
MIDVALHETPRIVQKQRRSGPNYGSNPETSRPKVQASIESASIIAGRLFRSMNRFGKIQSAPWSGGDVPRVSILPILWATVSALLPVPQLHEHRSAAS